MRRTEFNYSQRMMKKFYRLVRNHTLRMYSHRFWDEAADRSSRMSMSWQLRWEVIVIRRVWSWRKIWNISRTETTFVSGLWCRRLYWDQTSGVAQVAPGWNQTNCESPLRHIACRHRGDTGQLHFNVTAAQKSSIRKCQHEERRRWYGVARLSQDARTLTYFRHKQH